MKKVDRLDKQGCWIGAQAHSEGGEGGHLSPVGKTQNVLCFNINALSLTINIIPNSIANK